VSTKVVGPHMSNVRVVKAGTGRSPAVTIRTPIAGKIVSAEGTARRRASYPLIFVDAPLIHPLLPDDAKYDLDVSVIFGTYNRRDHLEQCVASVRRACAGLDYEIVISDGGSTDGSYEWMEEQEDIVPLRGDLQGAVRAFNQCFRIARGRYILNLNDDAELSGKNVKWALRHFADPLVAQVAFLFQKRGEKFGFENSRGRLYANYGLTRANVARTVEKLCGGFWCPEYYTYGADVELGMWMHRLGYRVVEEKETKVLDHQRQDDLRKKNLHREQGMSSKVLGRRWPTKDHLKFRGPLPEGSTNVQLLSRLESGELPEDRWSRIASIDPRPGEFPPQCPISKERLVHVQIKTDEDPQNSMVAALTSMGAHAYRNVNWRVLSDAQRDTEIRRACSEINPTVVFIQLQGPFLKPELIRDIRRHEKRDPSLVVAFWCGDIAWPNGPWAGFGDEWAWKMAEHSDVMLYSGTGQVDVLRRRGMKNAAYLQIGYDTDRYFPGPVRNRGKLHDVVFLGQNYFSANREFKTTGTQCDGPFLRRDVVNLFINELPGFGCYGRGWRKGTRHMTQARTGDVYRKSLMAISLSMSNKLGRYTSDRMLRIMACGCVALVKRFPEMEAMGFRHEETVLAWETPKEALAIAKKWLAEGRRSRLLDIGSAGAALVQKHHTWKVRMEQFSAILRAIRRQRT
jgi:hypothetical protein